MLKFFWTKSFKTPSGRKHAVALPHSRTSSVIAWVNIIFQLLFPLSLSFSSAIAASSSNTFAMNTATESYTLLANENVDTVAKKYNISVDELKK